MEEEIKKRGRPVGWKKPVATEVDQSIPKNTEVYQEGTELAKRGLKAAGLIEWDNEEEKRLYLEGERVRIQAELDELNKAENERKLREELPIKLEAVKVRVDKCEIAIEELQTIVKTLYAQKKK